MHRMLIAVTLAFTALLVAGMPVSAGVGWCRTDPIVLIDGRVVNITITGPLVAPLKVTGPNIVVVKTPPNVPTQLVLTDLGFLHGEIVRFETSDDLQVTPEGVEVEVRVFVPAWDTDMYVGVELGQDIVGILFPSRAEGTANEWVVLRTLLRTQ